MSEEARRRGTPVALGLWEVGMTAKVFRASPLSGVVVPVAAPERAEVLTDSATKLGSNACRTVPHVGPMWEET
jgi:hypothetical protein